MKKVYRRRNKVGFGRVGVLVMLLSIAVLMGFDGSFRTVVNDSELLPEVRVSKVFESKNEGENEVLDKWNLLLVNPWNRLAEDFEVSLARLSNGHLVDERILPDLLRMMEDARVLDIVSLDYG